MNDSYVGNIGTAVMLHGKSILSLALAISALTNVSGRAQTAPATGGHIGPSFSCARPHPADVLAQKICDIPSMAEEDLRYNQAYYALRHQVGPTGWDSLKKEAAAFDIVMRAKCGIPNTGSALVIFTAAMESCYIAATQAQRAQLLSRLSGSAKEEAERPLIDHLRAQAQLMALGFLSPGPIDGVYGPGMRSAIQAWQQSKGLVADGFMSNQNVAAIMPGTVGFPTAQGSARPVGPVPSNLPLQSPIASGSPDETSLPAKQDAPVGKAKDDDDDECKRIVSEAKAAAAAEDQRNQDSIPDLVEKNHRAVDEALRKTAQAAAKVDALGLDQSILPAKLMVFRLLLPYESIGTLRDFLASIIQAYPEFTIHPISSKNEKYNGFSIKKPGSPASNFVFRLEDDELYLVASGSGDSLIYSHGVDFAQQNAVLKDLKSNASAAIPAPHQYSTTFSAAVPLIPSKCLPKAPVLTPEIASQASPPPAGTMSQLDNTLERLRALQAQRRPSGVDNALLSSEAVRAVADRLRECWIHNNRVSIDFDQQSAKLIITTDASGIIRHVQISQAGIGSVGRAFAEEARRAMLDGQCGSLPLPSNMLGSEHSFEITFRP